LDSESRHLSRRSAIFRGLRHINIINQVEIVSIFCFETQQIQRGTLPEAGATVQSVKKAEVAQLVEQLIRNQQVVGSSPTFGSTFK
jgi:hypothetical protein